MSKYEVMATVYSIKVGRQIKICVGSFDSIVNARLFSEAYEKHYSSKPEIIEYKRV